IHSRNPRDARGACRLRLCAQTVAQHPIELAVQAIHERPRLVTNESHVVLLVREWLALKRGCRRCAAVSGPFKVACRGVKAPPRGRTWSWPGGMLCRTCAPLEYKILG